MDIEKEVERIGQEMIDDYHILHQNPELGREEYQTSAFLKEKLDKWGIEVIPYGGTSLVGILRGSGEGKTIALRADMDALPMEEKNEIPYVSQKKGVMHACGHDLHTAALLGAARILAQHKEELQGTVLFLFESDEEGSGYAREFIAQGALDLPKADKIYGIHVRPDLKCGVVGVKYEKSYAASDMFEVVIKGKSAHGAEPHHGVDSIMVASQIIVALQSIVARNISPTDSAIISIGKIQGGTAGNILAGETRFQGIIRTFGQQQRQEVKEHFVKIVEGISASMNAQAEIRLTESYPGVVNPPEETLWIQKIATELLGEDRVRVLNEPTLTTEDFGYYLEKTDGCFYHVGVESAYPLHNERFLAKEEALFTMAMMHIKSVLSHLAK